MGSKSLATRVHDIQPSGIRRIFDIACANPDGIDLSIGDPDFDVPELVKEESIHWIRQGFNRYVSTRGIPELREKIAEHLQNKKIHYEDFLVTAGATGAYFLAILSIVSPGDEVLILDPYFVAYANVVIMCGGVPKFIDTYPDFSLREESIVPFISSKTKAIVINHPNNPTGVVYKKHELELVTSIAEQFGLFIISDEIYDQFVYTDEPFVSVGNVATDAIVISGFSKRTAIPGWRLGYVSGPKEVINAMATFQQYSYVCANSIAQKAAVKAFNDPLNDHIASFRKRRDLLVEGLKDRFKLVKPEGAFYCFPEAPGGDADAFVNKAIEKKLFIIPGNVFSQRNTHFRISYAVPETKLVRAIEILNDLARQF